jgi:hypothetical protein
MGARLRRIPQLNVAIAYLWFMWRAYNQGAESGRLLAVALRSCLTCLKLDRAWGLTCLRSEGACCCGVLMSGNIYDITLLICVISVVSPRHLSMTLSDDKFLSDPSTATTCDIDAKVSGQTTRYMRTWDLHLGL